MLIVKQIHWVLSTIVLLLLLLAIPAFTQSLAQAPPPTGEWAKDENNPVLRTGLGMGWDSGGVFAPNVLAGEGGFQMWYTGQVATGTAVVTSAIGRATSTNGSQWTKDAGNPILTAGAPGDWDAGGVKDPATLKLDSTHHLWYTGIDAEGNAQIGYATSADGSLWTKHELNPVLSPGPEGTWDTQGVRPGTVLWINGAYHMWYTGTNNQGTAQIGYATSPDGVSWTKYATNPVLPVGPSNWQTLGVYRPAVIFDGTAYQMWYTGAGGDDANRIGHATSSDGAHWVPNQQNPVVALGEPGAWDGAGLSHPSVLFDTESGIYHMWYTGQAGDVKQIGHATAAAGYTVYLPLIRK